MDFVNIAEIKNMRNRINTEITVDEKSEPRTVKLQNGGTASVCDCVVSDESGTMKLSLWDDNIEKVDVGNKIRITNGYTNHYKQEIVLAVGRYGTIEVIE